jgi:hypothetical protein
MTCKNISTKISIYQAWPSAEQTEKEGLNLGEMNAVLLKKVEELTLYLLEKDKQLKSDRKDISELKETS